MGPTFRDYYGPLRTLNVERLLFSPLRGLTVVKRNAVLNGILQGPTLHASTLMVPKTDVLLLQKETVCIIPDLLLNALDTLGTVLSVFEPDTGSKVNHFLDGAFAVGLKEETAGGNLP